jgi:hypothetical protein
MSTNAGWLDCTIEPGMFPSEYAVEIDTADTGRVSLFASTDRVVVGPDGPRLKVDVLSDDSEQALIRLPDYAFEVGSRIVQVLRSSLRAGE